MINKHKLQLVVLCTIFVSLLSCKKIKNDPVNADKLANTALNNLRPNKDGAIKVLSYNLMLLDRKLPVPTIQWSVDARAEAISKASFLQDYDVLMLQECYDVQATATLKKNLLASFPYQTEVLGRTKTNWDSTSGTWGGVENGGSLLLSKWPIQKKMQHIFSSKCGITAGLSQKGFIYVSILKGGKTIHLITTHPQATGDPLCSGTEMSVRADQLKEMKAYVDALKIPNDEMVIYGGDFNVIRGTPEYQQMLNILQVEEPHYAGLPYTWDAKTNTIAAYQIPQGPREYLDYIFVSRNHLTPSTWQNLAFDAVSPSLLNSTDIFGAENYYWIDYSDHYPVGAFIKADTKTPVSSPKFRKYDRVSFKSMKTGKYISANSSVVNDWLTVSQNAPVSSTWFNLVNTAYPNQYNQIVSGKIRIETSEELNNFWYWGTVNSGPFYFYPASKTASTTLELEIIKKNGTGNSLEDGDIVAFKDYHRSTRYYLQVYQKDGTDWLYLNGSSAGEAETFRVKLNNTAPLNWSADLIY